MPRRATASSRCARRSRAVDSAASWQPVEGGVTVSVGGAAASTACSSGAPAARFEAPITFRRPARFLNDGVPDFERDLALDGTTLLGSVKSGLLVDVVAHGGPIEERAADIRAHVRRALDRWVAPHDAVSAAIAAAVLIGDRTGLPDETRERAAGGRHVSRHRDLRRQHRDSRRRSPAACSPSAASAAVRAALLTIAVLVAYAAVVTAGPSVWRATLMAIVYFAARAHRPSHAASGRPRRVAAAVIAGRPAARRRAIPGSC